MDTFVMTDERIPAEVANFTGSIRAFLRGIVRCHFVPQDENANALRWAISRDCARTLG